VSPDCQDPRIREILQLISRLTGKDIDWDEPSTGLERDDIDCIIDGLTALVEQRIDWQSSQREFEARFRSLVENSPDHISILDNQYQIQYVNDPTSKGGGSALARRTYTPPSNLAGLQRPGGQY
jgi:PAS domain-containing protein